MMALAEQYAPPRPKRPPRPESSLAQDVGAEIRRYRKLRGMTLADLAKRLQTTPQTVQRLESANMTMTLGWLERIAQALKVEYFQLLGGGNAVGLANAEAFKARTELAALRAAVAMLCKMVDVTVPEGTEISSRPRKTANG